ncbi:Tetratricopeptide repeat (TPR)-like superfamily protein [Euphorbia peplus]|nr:Tetratricopeptide repeat (TPR)-like superfamily protein [Euphorbia peplus]
MIIPATVSSSSYSFLRFRVKCSDAKPSRGFGANNNKIKNVSSSKEKKGMGLQQRKSATKKSSPSPTTQAPGLSSGKSKTIDIDFEERLQAVRRSALEQKKTDEIKQFGPIDYDAPVKSDKKTIGLGTKIGVGAAVLVFGLVFALGDFLPSVSDNPPEQVTAVDSQLSDEEKATLQTQLKQYEATLGVSPKDPVALEGAAVTLAELGDYTRAVSLLQDLVKENPTDPDVFRLLGEVKYELRDYEGSAAAYKLSSMVSKNVNFEVVRGLTNALLAAKKPDQAVEFLLSSRDRLNSEKSAEVDGSTDPQLVDTIQVNLLLGKAYSDWGHVSDAVSVYDQLISSHPNDFRGYLAKGIILKENGNVGAAERMFIQARFFAPDNAKALVDRYARR